MTLDHRAWEFFLGMRVDWLDGPVAVFSAVTGPSFILAASLLAWLLAWTVTWTLAFLLPRRAGAPLEENAGRLGRGLGSRMWRRWAVLSLGVALANVSSHLLKELLGRPRPPVAFRLVEEMNNALPSGHAVGVAALAMGITLLFRGRAGIKVALWAFALIVCWTRLYLGVHWLSDVLCGLAVGAVVMLLVVGVARRCGWLNIAPKTSVQTTEG